MLSPWAPTIVGAQVWLARNCAPTIVGAHLSSLSQITMFLSTLFNAKDLFREISSEKTKNYLEKSKNSNVSKNSSAKMASSSRTTVKSGLKQKEKRRKVDEIMELLKETEFSQEISDRLPNEFQFRVKKNRRELVEILLDKNGFEVVDLYRNQFIMLFLKYFRGKKGDFEKDMVMRHDEYFFKFIPSLVSDKEKIVALFGSDTVLESEGVRPIRPRRGPSVGPSVPLDMNGMAWTCHS